MADFATRLAKDVRLRFPAAEVGFADDNARITFGEGWCAVSSWIDADDHLSQLQAEEYIAETAMALVDNGWPDDVVWPRCPVHQDHPLQVGVIRGRASWYCSKDGGATAIAIGELSAASA
jgi:hypothetical protein